MSIAGTKIAEIRQERGLTQLALAKGAGIPQQRLSRIESGQSKLSYLDATALCAYLEIPIADLRASV